MTTVALDTQLQGYLDHLTIERCVAANTLSSYRRDLRRYTKHLSDRGNSRPGQGGRERRERVPGGVAPRRPQTGAAALSAVSAARALIAVRGLHRFAAAEGLAELDVARAVARRRRAVGCRKPDLDQVLALLEAAAATARPTAR